MNEILEQTLLYDFYGELLTAIRKRYTKQFVLDDLSLSEIAETAGISRQGVHDLVKRCQKTLGRLRVKAASGGEISFHKRQGEPDRADTRGNASGRKEIPEK